MKEFFKYTFASALGLLFALFGLMMVGGIAMAGLVAYSTTSTQKPVKENAVLHLDLEGVLTERAVDNPFGAIFSDYASNQLGLNDILSSIDKAAAHPLVKGIFIETGGLMAGTASVDEIRQALLRFKESGKFIIAYGDVMPQKEYYLSTVADRIIVNPIGMVEFNGLSAQHIFFKGLLDNLGVEVQVVKVGSFKSAVEPLILDKMSEANREQVTSYVSSLWSSVLQGISTEREIPVDSLNRLADRYQLFCEADSYLSNGLVDALMYRSQVDSLLKEMSGTDPGTKLNLVKATELVNAPDNIGSAPEKVAIIYAEGEIDGMDPSEGVRSEKLCEEIIKVRKDDEVKAVVLRVNSPGGSGFGSEQIWYELEKLKAEKPFVVSMGDMAASGGYYIACGADSIFAQPTTLTGSIGVFSLLPQAGGLARKVGLSFDEVNTNELSGFPSVTRPMTERERAVMQNHSDRFYEIFTGRCAAGRHKSIDEIKAVAEGRVWTGAQALEIGLVDRLGGLREAIASAASKAGLTDYSTVEYPRKKEFFEKLMAELGQDLETRVAKVVLGEEYRLYQSIRSIKQTRGVQARLPYDVTIK